MCERDKEGIVDWPTWDVREEREGVFDHLTVCEEVFYAVTSTGAAP